MEGGEPNNFKRKRTEEDGVINVDIDVNESIPSSSTTTTTTTAGDGNNNSSDQEIQEVQVKEIKALRPPSQLLRDELTMSLSTFVDLSDRIAQQIKILEDKETKWKELEVKMEEHSALAPNKIVLDIGGTRVATTKTTLLNQEGSFFHAMLASGRWSPGPDGMYFIDRNAKHISVILDFLRMNPVNVSGYSKQDLEQLKEDLDFYQIKNFPLPTSSSSLPPVPAANRDANIDAQLPNIMSSLLPDKTFRLIYNSNRDGFSKVMFRAKCFNKGPTIVIIRDSNSRKCIGGFNPMDWKYSGQGLYYADVNRPFLFVFNHRKSVMVNQCPLISEAELATNVGNRFMLNFGVDLCVEEGGNIYSRFPKAFEDSTGNLFQHFRSVVKAESIEVYQVTVDREHNNNNNNNNNIVNINNNNNNNALNNHLVRRQAIIQQMLHRE